MLPKILSAKQSGEVDLFTIENEPISSIDLMERASKAFVDEFCMEVGKDQSIAVICGTGNNGGDGFAISRLLLQKGYTVHPYLIQFSSNLSEDCKTNFNRLPLVEVIRDLNDVPTLARYDIIIDALLGTGLSRPVEGFLKQIIAVVNSAKSFVYAVDIASGVFCDRFEEGITAIESDVVISFQRPKMAFFMPEYGRYIQQWKVVDIGLDEIFIQSQESKSFVLDDTVKLLIKPRKRFSHKGTYGHALLIAGSYGKIGAAVLASKACLKSGAGLLTVHIPKCGYEILQISNPESMCIVDNNEHIWTSKIDPSKFDSLGLGPGIGKDPLSFLALKDLLQQVKFPIVIDADGINLVAKHQELLPLIPKNSILTPHIKEFDRLVGGSENAEKRWQKQLTFCKKHELIVVLKDAYTSVADAKGNLYFNTTGNPGMSTAGSGDVLTGIITGLMTQNYSPLESALIGVYYHGLAGDMASEEYGQMSVVASDIVDYLDFKRI